MTITVGFGGAKRLKLANSSTSQATITTRNGSGIELPFCEKSVQRSLAVSMAVEMACDWNPRWVSVFGRQGLDLLDQPFVLALGAAWPLCPAEPLSPGQVLASMSATEARSVLRTSFASGP